MRQTSSIQTKATKEVGSWALLLCVCIGVLCATSSRVDSHTLCCMLDISCACACARACAQTGQPWPWQLLAVAVAHALGYAAQ